MDEDDISFELSTDEDKNDVDYKPSGAAKRKKRKYTRYSRSNLSEQSETERSDRDSHLNETYSTDTQTKNPLDDISTSIIKFTPDVEIDEPATKKFAHDEQTNLVDRRLQAVNTIPCRDNTLGLKFQLFDSLDELLSKSNENRHKKLTKTTKKNKENNQTGNNNNDTTKFSFHLGTHEFAFKLVSQSNLNVKFECTKETSVYLYELTRDKHRNLIKSFNCLNYYLLLVSPNSESVLVELIENNELNRAILYLASNKCLYLTKSTSVTNAFNNTISISLDVYLTDKLKNSNLVNDPSEYHQSNYCYYVSLIMTRFHFSLIDSNYTLDTRMNLDELKCDRLTANEAKQNNENLFDLVYVVHSKEYGDQFKTDLDSSESKFIIEKSNLKPMLRPYQVNAVRWMLKKENFGLKHHHQQQQHLLQEINNIEMIKQEDVCPTSEPSDEQDADLHPLFVRIENKSSQVIYYQRYLGLFTSQAPLRKQSLPGGILADEMGLGKTLEILSCILINPRTNFPHPEQLEANESIKKLNQKTFSCLCGKAPLFIRAAYCDNSNKCSQDDEKEIYSCTLCGAWTHIDCVNYKGERDRFLCLKCCTQVPPIPSGCTLIVTPSVISHQWMDEIQKHVNAKLNVLFYTGCNQKFIQPQDLADLDICITTYDVLSNELSHVFAMENMRQLRKTKRFMNVPSPLTCVEWWRVCLDEAQMVHSTNTRCAEMAARLHAVNRWCVTGTPIGRSLADLHGLFTFIREDPYVEKRWFKAILYEPYIRDDKMPLANAVSRVLWRTAKKYVEDQINIPAQIEKTYWLSFSPFEQHLYERMLELFHETRRNRFRENGSMLVDLTDESANVNEYFKSYNKDLRLDELERSVIDHIMVPLLNLRLTCNHPQLVLQKRSFMSRGSKKERLLSMEKSLQLLMKKTETECESFLRSVTFHSNAMAGLHIIKNNLQTAKQIYEKILASENDYDHNIRVDSLQKVHTIFNLIYVLEKETNPSDRDQIDRIIHLGRQLKELESKYTLAFDEAKLNEENKLIHKVDETDKSLRAEIRNYQEWILHTLIIIENSSQKSKEFWERLGAEFHLQFARSGEQNRLDDDEPFTSSARFSYQIFNKSCSSYAELKQHIVSELDQMIKQRKNLIQKLSQFMNKSSKKNAITSELVKQAADCHLREKDNTDEAVAEKSSKCELCESENAFREYSRFIYSNSEEAMRITSRKEKKNDADSDDEVEDYNEMQRQYQQQINSTSDLEKLNRVVIAYCKSYQDCSLGKKFNEDCATLKEEFKLCRQFWIAVSNSVNSYDELDMVKLRMRLMQPNEKKLAYTIEEHLVDQQIVQNEESRLDSLKDLKKKYGQLVYLKSLIKTNSLGEDEENQEACPICQNNLGFLWYILSCGHSYCSECHAALINSESEHTIQMQDSDHMLLHRRSRNIRCALCREVSKKNEVYHVCTKKKVLASQNEEEKKIGKKLFTNDKSYEDYTSNELENIKIKGNCSSAKVEGIVKCLLKILKNDYEAKCLVFSENITMLELIQDLLKDNLIDFKFIKDNVSFQKHIQEFKKNPNVNVLLLPYAYGANGLNIIEATHVLLVEPTLNRGQEMQAIGRVHRIGQTKPTCVYRFVMRETIEELLYNLFKSDESNSKPKIDQTQPNCSAAFADQAMLGEEEDEEYKKFNQRKIVRIRDLQNLFINL